MPFWEEKDLQDMDSEEWESLCDGCARCCMIKLEDVDTGELKTTSLVCDLLDVDACRCTRYSHRHQLVHDCIEFTADLAAALHWLPTSCAYRRLAEGRGLAEWHPLVSQDPESVHRAGISVRGRVIAAGNVHPDQYEDHVITWVEV